MNSPIPDTVDVGGAAQPLLMVKNLIKHFALKKDILGKGGGVVRAVDGIDFMVRKGETLGVVGESGCGKSTTARLLMNLITADHGDIIFDGQSVGSRDLSLKEFRRQAQMVFQDSYASLNPRLTIEDSIAFAPQYTASVKRRRSHGRATYCNVWVSIPSVLPSVTHTNCRAVSGSVSTLRGRLPCSRA